MSSSAPAILFAGGGSGGHISPGLAIAERLRDREPKARAVFACSTRTIDRTMLEHAGEEFHPMPASPPSFRARAAWRFLRNYQQTRRRVRRLLRTESIDLVIALGGFVAAPCVAAARASGLPSVLVNLDAPPGKANRMIARKCQRVLSAVDLPIAPKFAQEVVGLPVRRSAITAEEPAACRRAFGLDPDRPVLLVTGASQGATSINAFMQEMARNHAADFAGWQILHLAGIEADEPLREAYQRAEIPAVVQPFTHEMGRAWGAADLAISRAGANSVAEVAINAVPSIFLPYPYHADQHQKHNAAPLIERGGAVLVDDGIEAAKNLEQLRPVLQRLMGDSAERARMRERLETSRPDDAAARIVEIVLNLISSSKGG